jgi:hypothetical protein
VARRQGEEKAARARRTSSRHAGRARRRQRERDALLAHPSEHGAAALAEVHAPEYEREEDVGALRLQDGLHTSGHGPP